MTLTPSRRHPSWQWVVLGIAFLLGAAANAVHAEESGAPDMSHETERRILPIDVDTSSYQLTTEGFQRAAAAALMQRGWTVTANEPNQVTGSLEKKGLLYKMELRFEPPYVTIGYVPGFASPRPNWLHNVKQNLVVEIRAQAP